MYADCDATVLFLSGVTLTTMPLAHCYAAHRWRSGIAHNTTPVLRIGREWSKLHHATVGHRRCVYLYQHSA